MKESEKINFHEYCDIVFTELFDHLIQHGVNSMRKSIPLYLGAVRRMEKNGEFK